VSPSRPRRKVPAQDLQQLFNNGQYLEKVQRNQLLASVESSRPAHPSKGQPPGTLSQMVWYFDANERVALVHQYLRPDGTIGASGLPDPKRLYINGEILYC
jgi:hypothetical protein